MESPADFLFKSLLLLHNTAEVTSRATFKRSKPVFFPTTKGMIADIVEATARTLSSLYIEVVELNLFDLP